LRGDGGAGSVVAEAGASRAAFRSVPGREVHESPVDYIAKEVGAAWFFDLGESDSAFVHAVSLSTSSLDTKDCFGMGLSFLSMSSGSMASVIEASIRLPVSPNQYAEGSISRAVSFAASWFLRCGY